MQETRTEREKIRLVKKNSAKNMMADPTVDIKNQITRMPDQILGGGFAPDPFYRGMSHDPCRYCDFGPVCQMDPQFRKSCYHPPVSAKEFWTLLMEGGEDDG